MADYHPLIARAVAGLDKNTGENRRALYERARTALVAQLRGVQPALDESEITRERLALEEAIRKVEAEAARQAREAARPTILKRAAELPSRRTELSSAAAASARSGSAGAAPRPQTPAAPAAAAQGSAAPQAAPPAPAEPPPVADEAPAQRPAAPGRRSLSDEALRGFRGVSNDPRQAGQQRRPEGFDRAPPEQLLPPAPSLPAPERHPLEEYGQLEPQMQPENLWPLPLDGTSAPPPVDFDEAAARAREDAEAEPEAPEPLPARARQPRSYSGLIRIALVLILVAAVGSLAYWQRALIGDLAGSVAELVRGPAPPPPREVTAPAQPKITDRVGQPPTQPSAGLPVAQRAVLYEEDPKDTSGKGFVGTVLWRTEMKAAAPGRPPELVVRGDIEVPERKLNVTWSLRRNTDQSLPASHTIEIMFNTPPDAPSGGIQNVPGVMMKQAEQTRGVPLAGLAVKVTPGFFLIGLSALESDMQRNLQLLKERSWFDILIVYNNNNRAILAMEKGTPGEKVFAEAFAAWKQ